MSNVNSILIQKLKKKNFIQDKSARSLSFFINNKVKLPVIDKILINIIKQISKKYNTDLRLNLHVSPKDKHHDMIILQRKNYHCPIHKHLSNGETIHIIYGSMNVILYDKNKKIISKVSLGKNQKICRIPSNYFHTVKITSKVAIYHENKKGPFVRSNTILY